jgi:hypothetical protein
MALDTMQGPGTLSPEPAPPSRQFSFTGWQVNNPTAPPPGDRLDGEFDRVNASVTQALAWTATTLNTDGTLRPGTVGRAQLQPGLFDHIARDIIGECVAPVDQVQRAASSALVSATQSAVNMRVAIAQANGASDSAGTASAAMQAAAQARDEAVDFTGTAADAAVQASNDANDAAKASNTAQDYAVLSQAWAEYLPGTIPPNILASNDITGDHWSARWWADRVLHLVNGVSSGDTEHALLDDFAEDANPEGAASIDWGSVNGMQANATPVFNQALALGDVLIPAGRYRFDTQPNPILARSVLGSRSSTVLVINYAAGDFLSIGGGGTVPAFAMIQGLRIECAVDRTSGATIHVNEAHYATVRDVVIAPGVDGGGAVAYRHYRGVQIEGGANQYVCHIQDFEIGWTQQFGIGLRAMPQDVFIQNGTIGNCTGAGLDMTHCSGVYVTDVDVISSGTGVLCAPAAGEHIVALFCAGVLADTTQGNCWTFAGAGQISDVHLTNCWASSSASGSGFFVNNSAINGITLSNCESLGNWIHGVHVVQGKNITVNACQIGTNSMSGDLAGNEVQIEAGVSDLVITNNMIGHVGAYAAQGYTPHAGFGISVEAGAGDRIIITGNKIDGGLYAPGVNHATGHVIIRDNQGWRTTASGVQKVASGQRSVSFPHNLVVGDPTQIITQITPTVNPSAAGVSRYWADPPTVGIGGTVTVWTDVVATNDFWFAYRIAAFE